MAWIKSLRQTERQLKKGCEILEKRASRYKEIIPLCEKIKRFRIGLPELLAFDAAVMKRVDEEGIPFGQAPYRVMTDIDDYNRLGGMKKQLYDTSMQINIVNEILAHRNNAVNALMKFQLYGITDEEILYVCEYFRALRKYSNNAVSALRCL